MKALLQKSFTRRCPRCDSLHVCRVPRKTLIENFGLRIVLLRPYRCEDCGDRYYGFALQKRAAAPAVGTARRGLSRLEPVLVYGCGRDNQPFNEEGSMRVVNASGAVVWTAARVEPGQKLLVMSPDSDEDRKCQVAYVAEEFAGQRMVGVIFTRPVPVPCEPASKPAPIHGLPRKALAS
jgi:hypothetical protein